MWWVDALPFCGFQWGAVEDLLSKKKQQLICKIQSYALKGFFSVNLFDKQRTYSVCKHAWPEF